MATVAWKVIMPPKLNEKEMRDELSRGMKKTQDTMLKLYKRTTKTWKHKPEFMATQKDGAAEKSVTVETDDEIYGYVDQGTKPHAIFAGIYTGKSNKKALAFPGTFTAKTVPGVIDARSGSSGGGTILRPYVQHPGTAPRNFSKIIGEEMQKQFEDIMGEALSMAAVKSYHGIRKL